MRDGIQWAMFAFYADIIMIIRFNFYLSSKMLEGGIGINGMGSRKISYVFMRETAVKKGKKLVGISIGRWYFYLSFVCTLLLIASIYYYV